MKKKIRENIAQFDEKNGQKFNIVGNCVLYVHKENPTGYKKVNKKNHTV